MLAKKRLDNAFIQIARVIVGVHREHARSYSRQLRKNS